MNIPLTNISRVKAEILLKALRRAIRELRADININGFASQKPALDEARELYRAIVDQLGDTNP